MDLLETIEITQNVSSDNVYELPDKVNEKLLDLDQVKEVSDKKTEEKREIIIETEFGEYHFSESSLHMSGEIDGENIQDLSDFENNELYPLIYESKNESVTFSGFIRLNAELNVNSDSFFDSLIVDKNWIKRKDKLSFLHERGELKLGTEVFRNPENENLNITLTSGMTLHGGEDEEDVSHVDMPLEMYKGLENIANKIQKETEE